MFVCIYVCVCVCVCVTKKTFVCQLIPVKYLYEKDACVYTAHTHSFLDVTRDVPAHFLCRQPILNLLDGFDENGEEEFDVSVAQSDLCRQLYHLNSTLKLFWRCWRVEYLSELRNAHHYHGGKVDAICSQLQRL